MGLCPEMIGKIHTTEPWGEISLITATDPSLAGKLPPTIWAVTKKEARLDTVG